MDKDEMKTGWFNALIAALPTGKLTAAQTANIISEALCVLLLIFLFFKISETLSFIGFFAMVAYSVWCFYASKPRRGQVLNRKQKI